MQYLISLPQNAVEYFAYLFGNDVGKQQENWFASSDPPNVKVGSGGGTVWILIKAWENWKRKNGDIPFDEWLKKEKRIIIHSGGKSRRVPAYASCGKTLIPVPVFRWKRGQRLNQILLDLQIPLLERILEKAPDNVHTLVSSGDALILSEESIPNLSDSDVICFGLSIDPSVASRHGVFVSPRSQPESLEYMLQKPSVSVLRELAVDYLFYLDLGLWLLSDRAIRVIMKKSGLNGENIGFYDLYGNFGLSLGKSPKKNDSEISSLTVTIIKLSEGGFYHFGTSRELISSSLALQNKVIDQSSIWTRNVKPHPAMFVQNAVVDIALNENQGNLWIENSHISSGWSLGGDQVITGVPTNDWNINLPKGISLDITPVGDKYAIRPYGIDDVFRGPIGDVDTKWMGMDLESWLSVRGLSINECGLSPNVDIEEAALFPLVSVLEDIESLIRWMIDSENSDNKKARRLWLESTRLSASEIAAQADIIKLEKQRQNYRCRNWKMLRDNYKKSVFYQVDLDHAAKEIALCNNFVPSHLEKSEELILRAHDSIFLSRLAYYRSKLYKDTAHGSRSHSMAEGENVAGEEIEKNRKRAFEVLREGILKPIKKKGVFPIKNVYEDQIVWARSPVRIDFAGGWTDTPPYSIIAGGKVVNISVELNGQPPLQAFIRPIKDKVIMLRSIDLGEREVVSTYEELASYTKVGSPFSIPKAALCLAGFHPNFWGENFSRGGSGKGKGGMYKSLRSQLEDFGSGIEISFIAAIPKGSGMGTSSILAATILGGLSDFCKLDWDYTEICNRTLALEQLLTTGGGWQDQYGGVVPGVKLLETESGWVQVPRIRWLPDKIFSEPEFKASMLLYYTGITRVAKNLLAEIVEGMFLNEHGRLAILREMEKHAIDTWDVIQQGDYVEFGRKIARTWELNKRIDADTTNPQIEAIVSKIEDFSLGYKLAGAGGGGYLFIVAKDPEAAVRIKRTLSDAPPNARARFVDMSISRESNGGGHGGLQISRS